MTEVTGRKKIVDFLYEFVQDDPESPTVDGARVNAYMNEGGREDLLGDSGLTELQQDVLRKGSLKRIQQAIAAEAGETYGEAMTYVPNILVVVVSKHT